MTPHIRVLRDRSYELVDPYSIRWTVDGLRRVLHIPGGYQSDGNSVPWFARPWIPGDWTLGIAPVLAHDYLYSHEGRLVPGEYQAEVAEGVWQDPLIVQHQGLTRQHSGAHTEHWRHTWTRRDVDRLFARLMREEGVAPWRRRMAYRAVRCAVWHTWDERPWLWEVDL